MTRRTQAEKRGWPFWPWLGTGSERDRTIASPQSPALVTSPGPQSTPGNEQANGGLDGGLLSPLQGTSGSCPCHPAVSKHWYHGSATGPFWMNAVYVIDRTHREHTSLCLLPLKHSTIRSHRV
uniref:Uncharacterized protein n=1 Tax=Mus musculus TaxID=10090 RepID=Q3TVA1_MOUSE|nr:unnamed protein product [Mus musculus]